MSWFAAPGRRRGSLSGLSARARPTPWRGDGQCDPGCDNAACGWDGDDCVDGAFARLVKGSRRAAGPLGPLLLLLLLAVSVGLTLLWRDDLTEAYFGRAK